MRYSLFIADIHLAKSWPRLTQLFISFLQNQAKDADALYILGDLFEAWIGDDDSSLFHDQIIQALRACVENGTPTYVMHGNRDFLLGKRFARESKCQLISDPYPIELYDTPTLLLHGDSLCTHDQAYMKFRRKARNKFFQQLFLFKRLKKRRAIAQMYRDASVEHQTAMNDKISDANFEEIPPILDKYNLRQLIHGHTHRPSIHLFRHHSQWVHHYVLSDWHDQGNYLICYEDGRKRLEYFR